MKRQSEIKLDELERSSVSFWDSPRASRQRSPVLRAAKRARTGPASFPEMRQAYIHAHTLMDTDPMGAAKLFLAVLEDVEKQPADAQDNKLYKLAGEICWNYAVTLTVLLLETQDPTDDKKIKYTKDIAQAYARAASYYQNAETSKKTWRTMTEVVSDLLAGLPKHSVHPQIILNKFLCAQKIYRLFLPYISGEKLDNLFMPFLNALEEDLSILLPGYGQLIYNKLRVINDSTTSVLIKEKVTSLMNMIENKKLFRIDLEREPFSSSSSSDDDDDDMVRTSHEGSDGSNLLKDVEATSSTEHKSLTK